MFKHSGWLVAGALVCFTFAGAALSGPTTPSQYDGCVYTSAGISLSDGQPAVVQCDSTGHVLVAATATLTNPTIGAAVPATANYIAGNVGGLLQGVTLENTSGAIMAMDVKCVVGCGGNANGQATMANSAPVVIASNQSNVPVSQATAASLNATVIGAGAAGTANAGVVTVQGIASMTKLLVTPDSVALPANQSVNMAQVAGTTTDTNSGAKSAGTMRVVLATDQPALTNKLLVTPDSVALPANQSTNESQINGVTPLMGNGVTGTGSQRVTIASDNTAFSVNGTLQTQTDTVMIGGVNVKEINAVAPLMGNGVSGTGAQRVTIASDSTGQIALAAGAATIGALTANQSVNIAQMNGVTTTMNAGVVGTGVQRVTLASDQTTLTNTIGNVGEVPITSGGLTFTTLTLAASTNATNVKASAGQLYSITGFNMSSATPIWISLYNNSGTPTCGTSIVYQALIPGSTTGAGFVLSIPPGLAFSTGIAFCATTGIAGTGNAAATTYVVNFGYK